MNQVSRLSKKVSLITGASSGIGRSIAFELAAKGHHLLLVSNQEMELESTRLALQAAYSVEVITYLVDLRQQEAATELYSFCSASEYHVDVLINNAGILIFSEVVDTQISRVRDILQLHMYTPTMLCRLFAEGMKLRGEGYILNVSSMSAVMPYPGISLYGPTKTYLRYFSRALRSELAPYGVRVSCLMPGATATGLYDPRKVDMDRAIRLGVMKTADSVAKAAIQGMYNNKAEIVPGFVNKLVVFFFPLIPHRFIMWVNQRAKQSRRR